MLRHLLGHWKAHRRKPSLLPEDIESPSDDPSKVNPIYEDSEGSVASSLRHDSESPNGDRTSTTGVDLDLVDISIPIDPPESNAIEENPDDVINQINIALDNSLINDELSEEQISDTPEPKHKEIDDLKDIVVESMENNNMPSEKFESSDNKPRTSRLHQIIKSHPELKKELTSDFKVHESYNVAKNGVSNTKSSEQSSVSKPNEQPSISKTSEQPSVTKSNEQISVSKSNEQLSVSKPSEPSSIKQNQDKQVTSVESAKTEQVAELSAVPSSSTGITADSSKNSEASPVSKEDQVSEMKPKSFRKRAIDELIKKFQGQNTENSSSVLKVSSFLHSSNRKDVSKEQNSKDKNKAQSSLLEDDREKESLSKIFNFPPPPPVEPKKNGPLNNKTSVKETKITSSEAVSKVDNNSVLTEVKTRTDSSLSRNKTVASSDTGVTNKHIENVDDKPIESSLKKTTQVASSKPVNTTQIKSSFNEPISKKEKVNESIQSSSKEKYSAPSPTKTDDKLLREASLKLNKAASSTAAKESSSALAKPKAEIVRKQSGNLSKSSRSPESKRKASISKTVPTVASPQKDTEEAEDSGITRGDQISSEAPNAPNEPSTAATPQLEPQKEDDVASPVQAKRNTKERRTLQSRSKACKRCKRHSYDGEAPLKRGQCDDYYDILTGLHRKRRAKYTDSWTSDLSREERDLIRRLRSRRDTLRSNGPAGKVRHSRHSRHLDNGYFHRHHAVRRSVSDDSTFSSSLCSCDDCWLFLVKDYAYGRASLRGITPAEPLCTCRVGKSEFGGRRVKFRSETIPEASPSERTSTSPPIPEESSKKGDATDTRSTSNLSSGSQESVLKNGKLPDKTSKKLKNLKDNYRLVTPWELEEWDQAMKRHLLKKRRKRARYMGFMALAMVVFVGLVVAILMVYLRRKVL
ncbi:uncharacterized protein NPIL_690461 [Nephila pilipes]|uniref:Uncharacterized protein n=1 Tax=Nephila pilipes TaxID=299642 RepID=A0A8X6QS24_NEPPI|nr:uncharacterized protein NPIL_690461 [Nephila pilipes]